MSKIEKEIKQIKEELKSIKNDLKKMNYDFLIIFKYYYNI